MSIKSPRLLALDGGGIRGLSSLQILKQLMIAISRGVNPIPKPCEYFDLIGGTSTGGLIAIMLGRLEMDVDACIEAYLTLSHRIFQKKRNAVSKRLKIQGRFDSTELEGAIKDILAQRNMDPDTPLLGPPESKCKVFVCATSSDTKDIVQLRSYVTSRSAPRDIKIWEAARATSAAPSFFDPITVGSIGETFIDGALGANNPIHHLWTEAQDLCLPTCNVAFDTTVHCIVSIGTGTPSTASFNSGLFEFGGNLSKIITECDATAEKFVRTNRALSSQGRYYRFSVQGGLGDIAMDDTEQMAPISAATNRYIESEAVFNSLQACARVMRGDYANYLQEHLQVCRRELIDNTRFEQVRTFDDSAWLFENDAYQDWIKPRQGVDVAAALLTLKGKPGGGKSVLMKDAVQAKEPDSFTIKLHHFFDFCSPASGIAIYRSLLGQIIGHVPQKPWDEIKEWGEDIKEHKGDTSSCRINQLSTEDIKKAIHRNILENKIAPDSTRISFRIFIDAINECETEPSNTLRAGEDNNQISLLNFIQELLDTMLSNGVDIGVCISRQAVPYYGASEPETRVIEVDKHNNKAVRTYIEKRLKKLNNQYLEWKLGKKLYERTRDGFLWARLVTKQILENSFLDDDTLVAFVDGLPLDLDGIYQRMLKGSKETHTTRTLEFLQVAIGALKPMTSDQFRQTFAFTSAFQHQSIESWESSGRGLHPEKFPNRLQGESRGLLEIATVEANKADEEDDTQVRFIHGSVLKFLRDKGGLGLLDPECLTMANERCHLLLFKCCMRALDRHSLRGQQTFPFLEYACGFWLQHARYSGDLFEITEPLPDFILDCNEPKAVRVIEEQKKHFKAMQAKEYIWLTSLEKLYTKISILVLLATMGCDEILKRHLESCSICNKGKSQHYGAALSSSIRAKSTRTASLLIEFYCKYNDINSLVCGKTLLYDSCYFCNEDMGIVRLLLEKGADACVRTPKGQEYPLHAAITKGNSELIEILLRAQGSSTQNILAVPLTLPLAKEGWTALHHAIGSRQPSHKRLRVLKTILNLAPENAGLLDVVDLKGNTALDLAKQVDGDDGHDLLDALNGFRPRDKKFPLDKMETSKKVLQDSLRIQESSTQKGVDTGFDNLLEALNRFHISEKASGSTISGGEID